MEKIVSVIKLMAKTGLFFANADGIYQKKEKRFIEDFVSGINQIAGIEQDVKQDVLDSLDKKFTLNEVIAETNALVKDFSAEEREAILRCIENFIKKVIDADGHVHPLEAENFRLWRQAVSLE